MLTSDRFLPAMCLGTSGNTLYELDILSEGGSDLAGQQLITLKLMILTDQQILGVSRTESASMQPTCFIGDDQNLHIRSNLLSCNVYALTQCLGLHACLQRPGHLTNFCI